MIRNNMPRHGLVLAAIWTLAICTRGVYARFPPSAEHCSGTQTDKVNQNLSDLPAELQPPTFGGIISAEKAEQLERGLFLAPEDFAAHVRLLVYYGAGDSISEAAIVARRRHLLWIVHNRADSRATGELMRLADGLDSETREQVRDAWRVQIAAHPNITVVNENAARFMKYYSLPEELEAWMRVERLEPDDPGVKLLIGGAFERQMARVSESARQDLAGNAVDYFVSHLHDQTSPTYCVIVYRWIVTMAMASRKYEVAKHFAEKSLKLEARDSTHSLPDPLQFAANTALGRLALRDGDVAAAVRYLTASAVYVGPDSLDFGLARDLLLAGKRDEVIRFLDRVVKRIPIERRHVEGWEDSIHDGFVPEFTPQPRDLM